MNTRFQWLVALRYLMARPRHVSPVLGWICAVLGTAWFASVILENFVWDVQVLEGDIVTEHPYHQLVRYIAIGAGLFFQVFLGLFVVRWLCSFFTTVSVGGVFIGTMALVMVELLDKATPVIHQVAKKNGFTMVFERTNSFVVWANDDLDITEQVKARL